MPARGPDRLRAVHVARDVRPRSRRLHLRAADGRRRRQPFGARHARLLVAAPQPAAEPDARRDAAPGRDARPRRRRRARPWSRGRSAAGSSSSGPAARSSSSLRGSDGIPVGSEVNAKNGRVRLTIEPGDGKPLAAGRVLRRHLQALAAGRDARPHAQRAARGVHEASGRARRSARRRRASCGATARASSARAGRYSAATVRGTIWLVAGHLRRDADAGPPGRRVRARQRRRRRCSSAPGAATSPNARR